MKRDGTHDVVAIGYGPVSQVLALILARRGWRVAVVERWRERYAMLRAVCIDHELYRMLHVIGLGDELEGVIHPAPVYRWFNADWEELLSIDWSSESISGGSEVNFVHQPTLEEMSGRVLKREPLMEVHPGLEAVRISQTPDHAEVEARDPANGITRLLRGRYLVGADEANSLVRRSIESNWEDKGCEADWLVLDVLPHEGVDLDVPPAAQWCNPQRPTTIVPAGVRDERRFRYWEFMRLPDETVADIESEEVAWHLLAPWVRPDQATLVRHKVYTFRSLIADRWRDERILIAGDAAHVMPPFMGQGMCAGLRNDWNLAWKLDLVLRGQAGDELLDTYQTERRPHASTVIDMSMYLGKVICIPDAAEAALRDEGFLNGTVPPPPDFPHLSAGLIDLDPGSVPRVPAGPFAPHSHVADAEGMRRRFDRVVESGFVVVARGPVRDMLAAAERSILDRLSVHVAVMDGSGPASLTDVEGKLLAFMERHGLLAMVIRPDIYLYGDLRDFGALLERLDRDLAGFGTHFICAGRTGLFSQVDAGRNS